ncbi:33960_t:CDS:2 [Gigaspora margarita]|uniref:33960_t:CDS:1 n=1 Tax=Gigaspora margarita TaxID=4874 RepID=A0ABM8VYC5_GIGMA|nr:33960_t:CDS:2 [Gigaspora margarita]
MSKKQKKGTEPIQTEGSTLSEETIESTEPSGSQEQDNQSQENLLSPETKPYLNAMIQTSATSIIQTMRQYMDQQFETINRRFEQLEQANIGSNELNTNNRTNSEQVASVQQTQNRSQEVTRCTNTGGNMDQTEGNYPLTPILNKLIIEADPAAISSERQEKSGVVRYKVTSRKFLALDYAEIKQLSVVKKLSNPRAIETEGIHLWWVSNWNEGQKLIETLPQKPSLTNKMWKLLAFGIRQRDYIDKEALTYQHVP